MVSGGGGGGVRRGIDRALAMRVSVPCGELETQGSLFFLLFTFYFLFLFFPSFASRLPDVVVTGCCFSLCDVIVHSCGEESLVDWPCFFFLCAWRVFLLFFTDGFDRGGIGSVLGGGCW